MRQRLDTVRALLIAGAISSSGALAQESVATPALDASIFKDGEVESRAFAFGEWHAKCQQILKIKKRICNLLSTVADSSGKIVGSVIIATTDVGIPAMMISIPSEISQKKEILLYGSRDSEINGKVVKVEFSQSINAMICDTTCKYMFPLDPKLVFILNAGEGLKISITSKESPSRTTKKKPPVVIPNINLTISGIGFAEILGVSAAAW